MSITAETAADKHKQVREIFRIIEKRLEPLWDDLPRIDEVGPDAAVIGTTTALIQKAAFLDGLWYIQTNRDCSDAEKMRERFLQLAADCYDDFNDYASKCLADDDQ